MFSGVVTGDIQSIIEVGCSLLCLFLTNVCHGNTKTGTGTVVSEDAHRQTESSGTETGTVVSKDTQRQ